MKKGKDRSHKTDLRDTNHQMDFQRTSGRSLDLDGEMHTRKPGSQSKSGGRHNNGRGGGK